MADNNTNVDTELDEQGNNDVDTKGSDTDNTQKNQERTFTQKDIDNVIRQKQAEWKVKYQKEFEKTLEGKQVLSDDDLKKLRTSIETEVKTSIALENKRAEYKSKGLTDVQLDTVQVEKIEDYDTRVNELFGALLKKDAPVLNGGKQRDTDSTNDPNKSLNERLRQGFKHKKP